MNLKPVSKTRDSSTKMGLGDAAAGDDEGESSGKGVSQKRKQDSFLVEVQERAEVLFIEQNEQSDFLHFKVALYSHSASLCCRLF